MQERKEAHSQYDSELQVFGKRKVGQVGHIELKELRHVDEKTG